MGLVAQLSGRVLALNSGFNPQYWAGGGGSGLGEDFGEKRPMKLQKVAGTFACLVFGFCSKGD